MSPSAREAPTPAALAERLRKVLLLERDKGCADTAVVGGMDAFLRLWGLEAHERLHHPMIRSALRKQGLLSPTYGEKTIQERSAWIEQILRWSEALHNGPSLEPRSATSTSAAAKAATVKEFLGPGQGLDTPIAQVRAVHGSVTPKLAKLGISTVRDLLYHFPRRHLDFTHTDHISGLEPGQDHTIVGTVWEVSQVRLGLGGRRRATEAVVGDDTGNVRIIWWNQPYLARTLKRGGRIAISGRVGQYRGRPVFDNPEFELVEGQELVHAARLVPVYPLTEGLTSRRLRGIIKHALGQAVHLLVDFLPGEQRQRLHLMALPQAVAQAHFPESQEAKERSRRRLAFDELFLIQLGVMDRKREWKQGAPGHPLHAETRLIESVLERLPFSLTGAQRRVLEETLEDMAKSTPMSRLVQGEVGSGKTVVALVAMLVAAANGHQVAFMAPTEILAEQHYRTVRRLLGDTHAASGDVLSVDLGLPHGPVTTALLTGGMTRKRKQDVQSLIGNSEVDVVIGTHALFQKDVEFANLGLVIVDEQHRFGVMQRSELRQKGYNPHVLVMTATPIPRTLSLTLYGDLDLSVIDELPAGRQIVQTRWIDGERRETAYEFIRREVGKGRQAFVIYPLIEESAKLEAAAAQQEHDRLSRDVFPDLRLGLLHGRMKATEKDQVMRRFQGAELDILVSTPVVEVGIDIANATVMLVDSAERFGLAQLHQFRGRVGRGEHQSYCILVSETFSEEARERLRIMEETHDGFELAEADLRIRGPGEFFGTRQSGLPDLRMARLSDVPLLELARDEAAALFERDPELELAEHRAMAEAVDQAWAHRTLAPGEA